MIARDAEFEQLKALVTAAHRRGSSRLVLGPPGIGKTTLLDAVAALAPALGVRVVRIQGSPGESPLALAGLQALLEPLMGFAHALPDAHRAALRGVLGGGEAPAQQLFLVALATLDLLAEAATEQPLLVLADDLHWIDVATVQILTFVARRLESDPIVLVATSRDPLADSGLGELQLDPLDSATSAALLQRTAPHLDAVARRAILDASEGNPLALTELPKAFSQQVELTAAGELPLTSTLERAFAARLPELGEATATALLVAALNDSGSAAEALQVTAHLCAVPVQIGVLDDAVEAGLIAVDRGVVRFRHPLVRSAVVQAATDRARRAAHTALAKLLDGQPDRRAWHRAAAAVACDERIATDLESAAWRAERNGAIAAAVLALRRAAQLSEAESQRNRRLLRAAELAVDLGRPDEVARLLAGLKPSELTVVERLRLERTRERADLALLGGAARVDELVRLSELASRVGEPNLALDFLGAAGQRCWIVGAGQGSAADVVAALDRLPIPRFDPRRVVTYAYAAPLTRSREVLALLEQSPADPDGAPSTMDLLGRAASSAGAFPTAESYYSVADEGLRSEGRLAALAAVLTLRAWAVLRCGRWALAMLAAEEGARLAHETRQPVWRASALSAQAMVCGLRGDSAAALRLADEAAASGQGIALATVQLVRCAAAAATGSHDEAFEHLWRVYQPGDPAYHLVQGCWAIGYLAETARDAARRERARGQLAALEPLTIDSDSQGFRVAMAHARAVLAEPETAEQRFQDALAADLSAWPFDHARLLLAYGAWLRRVRRVTESREPLRLARDELDRLGATPWATRARHELRAAGESSAERRTDASERLSSHELRIARLVAQGLSNKEIGQRLYLSHRTISSQLHTMFPKLGITSRAQMAHVLSDVGES